MKQSFRTSTSSIVPWIATIPRAFWSNDPERIGHPIRLTPIDGMDRIAIVVRNRVKGSWTGGSDAAGQPQVTTDHQKVRARVAHHGGHAARVGGTSRPNDPVLIRTGFPGFSGEESLEPISWDDLFEGFDQNTLAVLRCGEDRFGKVASREMGKARRRED